MKRSHPCTRLPLLAILLACTCLPGNAHAWFGRERARMLKQADETYEAARVAGEEGRVLDEIAILTDARTHYGQLMEAYPDYRKDHVETRFRRCGAHLRIIATRIKSGEITIPSPDAIVDGAGRGYVDKQAATPPARHASEPSLPGHRVPIPPLVDLSQTQPEPEPAPARANAPGTPTDEAPDFSRKQASPAGIPREEDETASDASSPARQALEQADESLRIRLIDEMIASRRAPEAVLLLEDLVEDEPADAPPTTRLLLVRALLECRNYRRAESELEPLLKTDNPLPATRSLAATIAFQNGRLAEAMFQMDRLVSEHPAYADAYINMAYLYFRLDADANREMAIICYRSGIASGARRDPAFETALGISVTH